SRRRHTIFSRDWSSDVCSSDLELAVDLGCGAGNLTRELSALAATTVAVDVSLRAVAHAVAGSGGEILGVVADIDAVILPLADGKIGRASCRERREYRCGRGSVT